MAEIEDAREERRIQALERRHYERRRTVNIFYEAYKAQRTAFDCRLLPNPTALCGLPELKDRIEADLDVDDSFSDIEERLPSLILAHDEMMKRKAQATLADAGYTTEDVGAIDLNLATSVLQCGRCDVLIFGWIEHQLHQCTPNRHRFAIHRNEEYRRPPLLSTSVVEVIRLAGLDPATATVGDMDAPDLHFFCPTHNPDFFGVGTLTYFSWRSYVCPLLSLLLDDSLIYFAA